MGLIIFIFVKISILNYITRVIRENAIVSQIYAQFQFKVCWGNTKGLDVFNNGKQY